MRKLFKNNSPKNWNFVAFSCKTETVNTETIKGKTFFQQHHSKQAFQYFYIKE